ncbi:hypothetical_protein [Candidozyma auris]|uniref:hypothetical_protein n=1 Tax=Candidozyma auris TaxID=498019 RepID=UPI000D2AE61E|nr:hypothetical_protein [[Candida] auris]QEO23457.1 hypothetical_protein [[Candida] auris]GBL51891.1 hypothetical protein CAJCM15448_41650 [[Candida] auris]
MRINCYFAMDYSDEETQPQIRPVFKKKAVKKVRASKRAYEDVLEDVAEKSPVTTEKPTKSKALERLLRFKTLSGEVNEESNEKDKDVDETATSKKEAAQSGSNTAYKVLEIKEPAKTFSLRESHFREKPVAVENEYGSDWENDKPAIVKEGSVSDHEMDIADVEYTVSAPQADPDQYYTEIVSDVDMDEGEEKKSPRTASSVPEYIMQLRKNTEQHQETLESARRRLEVSKWRVEQLEARKAQLLKQAANGRQLDVADVEQFIRGLYQEEKKVTPMKGSNDDDVDMMSLFAQ